MKAFPNVFLDYIPKEEYRGMDLRDYFAAKAIQGILASDPDLDDTVPNGIKAITEISYEIADAMMEARK
jgi:hypothetical protein